MDHKRNPWLRVFGQRLISLRESRHEVWPLLCLVGTWLALRRGFFDRMDVPLWDETEYLTAGWRLLHHGDMSTLLPGSPLYLGWYALWHLPFAGDAATVLFAQWLTVDLAIALVAYLVVRSSGAGRMAAYLVAAYWSSLVFSSDLPRVGFLAFLLVLIAGLCEYRGKRVATGILLVAAALVRQEYLLVLLLWLAIGVWPLWNRKVRLALAGVLCIALPLGAFMTLSGVGGNRLWTAFAQHYAMRWARQNPSSVLDPWTDHAEVIGRAFPGANSLGDVLWAYPVEFLQYLAGNLSAYPGLLIMLVFSPALPGRYLGPLLLALVLLAVCVRRGGLQLPSWHITPVLGVASVSVTASLLVSPKAVYALPLAWLLLFGMARLGRSILPREPLKRPWVSCAIWIGLAVLPWCVPTPSPRPLPVARTIASLRTLWSQQPSDRQWRMLEIDGGWCSHIDLDKCTSIWLWRKPRSLGFSAFLRQEDVNAVMLSPVFLRHSCVRDDAEFQRFRREPASFGFRESRLPHGRTLYLRDGQPRPQ